MGHNLVLLKEIGPYSFYLLSVPDAISEFGVKRTVPWDVRGTRTGSDRAVERSSPSRMSRYTVVRRRCTPDTYQAHM